MRAEPPSLELEAEPEVIEVDAEVMEVDAEGQPVGAPSGDVVVPTFVLPSSYQLPAAQQSKRKCVPGAPKWTAKRRAQAAEDIAAGKDPTPLPSAPAVVPAIQWVVASTTR